MRVVNQEACDSLNASLRHIAVHVSGVVGADVKRVWEAVRDFGAVSKWLPAAEASVLKVLLMNCVFRNLLRGCTIHQVQHPQCPARYLEGAVKAGCFSPRLLLLQIPGIGLHGWLMLCESTLSSGVSLCALCAPSGSRGALA